MIHQRQLRLHCQGACIAYSGRSGFTVLFARFLLSFTWWFFVVDALLLYRPTLRLRPEPLQKFINAQTRLKLNCGHLYHGCAPTGSMQIGLGTLDETTSGLAEIRANLQDICAVRALFQGAIQRVARATTGAIMRSLRLKLGNRA